MTLAEFGNMLCGTEQPTLFGAFDLSTPPALLFYSYVPIALVTLAMGVFAYVSAQRSRESGWLLAFSLFFFGWVVDILVQWVASYHSLLLFAWKLNLIFEVGLFLSAVAFIYVFAYERDLPPWSAYVLAGIALIAIAITPTPLNIQSYDIGNCQGIVGAGWFVVYALEPAAIVLMGLIGYRAVSVADARSRARIGIATAGTLLAFASFWFSNYYGELAQAYDFNLWGPIGMVVFQLVLGYLIVRYQAFNAKVFAAQALVITLVVLIGSELFFVHSFTNRMLVSMTLMLSIGFGWLLERSVKAEIQQREKIEEQERALEAANAQQVSLLHFISHEVKGSLNKAQGVFAGLVEGDYGDLPDSVRNISRGALGEVAKGITMVMDLLAASDLKKGTMSFEAKEFDCTAAVRQAVDNARLLAKDKGLHVEFVSPPTEAIRLKGDEQKLMRHVFRNLLENAIRYTPSGFVRASLTRAGAIARFTVEDSGVGITDDDKQKLFTEGGHGKDSIKVNVDSTGFGLFIAKQVVDAHHGKIWAESDGAGKGSRFVVELPTQTL